MALWVKQNVIAGSFGRDSVPQKGESELISVQESPANAIRCQGGRSSPRMGLRVACRREAASKTAVVRAFHLLLPEVEYGPVSGTRRATKNS